MYSQISKLALASGILFALAGCASLDASIESGVTPDGDQRFTSIHEGETQTDVRETLGNPSVVTAKSLAGTTTWMYPYVDSWGYQSDYDISFDPSGTVVSTFAARRRG